MIKVLMIKMRESQSIQLNPLLSTPEPIIVGYSDRIEDAICIAYALSTIWAWNEYKVVVGDHTVQCTYVDGIPQH